MALASRKMRPSKLPSAVVAEGSAAAAAGAAAVADGEAAACAVGRRKARARSAIRAVRKVGNVSEAAPARREAVNEETNESRMGGLR